ncbi:dipeptidase [Ponticaulis sp.]|uniref:dipeptidase n=1 Tax=Ponticaulis sp. TaxID=2020902 RepID=UPI000B7331D1|nr:dipeptidase [Ponticaulis sp.]MAI90966.1 peptidase M19 [Ponticaulis sp.]OUX98307.1 MAG: peptidase M19 [Hyphomonadaceae bacterium TMED5]|tara:strand:- start:172839 stop:174116 length:1278 start_codon:yes stop_codon:yes gene_type:complete
MVNKSMLRATGLATILAIAACQTAPAQEADTPETAADFMEHHQALTILDTHLDTPAMLIRPGFDIMERHDAATDYSQVDVPRMDEGGLDGGWWVIYTPQGPLDERSYELTRDIAVMRAVAVREMVAANPETFEIAETAADAQRIADEGKKVVMMSIENSYPLGTDVSLLETFYHLGVRMVGPVHFRNNQFADSGTDIVEEFGGLSPLGEELVVEANRLGMVLDASHASDGVFDDLIRLSGAPIILSHSGTSAIYDHPRNIDDDRLRTLAEHGGVIQINALGSYLKQFPANPERDAAFQELRTQFSNPADMSEEDYAEYLTARNAIDAQFPPAMASFEDFMEQLLHALRVMGPEHVGIGPDWDGGGGVIGLEDVSDYPAITSRLLAEGYTWEDMENIMGGNSLRVLQAAEDYAAELAAAEAEAAAE